MKKLLVAVMIASQLSAIASSALAQWRPAANPACAPVPRLELEPGFVDPRRVFGPSSSAMRATRAAFEIAYRRACRERIVRGLFVGAASNVLMLRNSPQANVASIFMVSINRERGTRGRVLEYPFVTEDGVLHVPTADEIREAIYCGSIGATAREQEEEGRCLPD